MNVSDLHRCCQRFHDDDPASFRCDGKCNSPWKPDDGDGVGVVAGVGVDTESFVDVDAVAVADVYVEFVVA